MSDGDYCYRKKENDGDKKRSHRYEEDERSYMDKYNKQDNDTREAKKQKISLGFSKPSTQSNKQGGIQIKLGQASTQKAAPKTKPITVASAFNQDSDSEPEEMPPEAKMRMKNIGRDTPTSSGPNSFGKTKHGFCDSNKVFEKNLKQAQDAVADS